MPLTQTADAAIPELARYQRTLLMPGGAGALVSLAWLAARGFDDVEQISVAEEGVRFSLPAGVRPSPTG